mgnify:CR=1 FL=1
MINKGKAAIKLYEESLSLKKANKKLSTSGIKLNGDDFVNSMQRIKHMLKNDAL